MGGQILNNSIYNVGRSDSVGAGIEVYVADGTVIQGNTVSRNQPFGIRIESVASNTVLGQNIVSGNATDVLDLGVNTLVR
jgi:parallel beta-helix repeat protein